ncbi:amino acid adenylation domain-containing protein [Streptomyces sp. NPDC058398]|uniref:amino acid adenylation domain-containing protein n=1 Tax=Streptomyces sp. NPDC058398 TaxID=3346479 RepID=UPI0036596F4E
MPACSTAFLGRGFTESVAERSRTVSVRLLITRGETRGFRVFLSKRPGVRLRESLSSIPLRSSTGINGHAGPAIEDPWLDRNIFDIFLEVARRNPDRVAVREGSSVMTYEDLAARVMAVVDAVTRLTQGPGETIAVLTQRGAGLIAALVGILGAGRVYVPLDPEWPEGRTADVLERCGASLVMTDDPSSGTARGLAATVVIPPPRTGQLTEGGGTFVHEPAVESTYRVGDRPAYTIFTSGTTGRPKGAVNTHRGLMNHLAAKIEALGLTAFDRVAQTAPQGFDISVWQMLAPLLVGAECVVVDDVRVREPEALLTALRDEGVTVLEVVPSLMYPLIEEIDRARYDDWSLRWLLLGGESVKSQLCTAWHARFPSIPIMNVYGPTECADDVTHHVIRSAADLSADGAHTPIGTPLRNTTLHVLRWESDVWVPCGPDEKGELFVTGLGVGMGYVGDAEATARAFFKDPFDETGCMYRTGDTAVVGADGVFVCLGRQDRQVKIRGHRIELEEIESRILATGLVRQCAVLLYEAEVTEALVTREMLSREPVPGGRRKELVAFLVPADGADAAAVREKLEGHLPRVMMPDQMLPVDTLPVTPNGKADYTALTRRLQGTLDLRPDWIPADGLEAEVAQVWHGVVGRYPQSPNEELAEAGIDSLQAMLLSVRLGRTANCRVPTAEVLKAVSFRSLLDLVSVATATPEAADEADDNALPAPGPDGVTEQRLARQQEGAWFHWQLDPDSPYYTYQGYLDIRGRIDTDAVRLAWQAVMQRHRHLTGLITATEDGPRLRFPVFDLSHLEITDLRTDEDPLGRFRAVAASAVAAPFDLDTQPFLRAAGFRIAEDRFHLLLTTHELALDGWAADVFTRDFAQQYSAARGEHAADPGGDPAAAYGRYVAEQSRLEGTESYKASRHHWAAVLGDHVPTAKALDRASAQGDGHDAGLVQRHLAPETDQSLRRLARETRTTDFVVLATALGLALATAAGEDDLVIGVPVTDRTMPGADDVTAFLINMVPVRIRLDGALPFAAAVRQVGATAADALAHARVPLADTVAAAARNGLLGAGRSLFHVMLNMLNFPTAPAAADESTTVSFRELWTGCTKYPLAFYAQPREGALHLELAYLKAGFDRATSAELLDGFVRLIDIAVGSPADTLHHIASKAGLPDLTVC